MKSQFGDRETLGTMLVETHDEHMKSTPIEVGDFVAKFGKQYMKDLFNYIEIGSKNWDKFYINILSKKSKLYMGRAIEVEPYVSEALPMMQPNQEVWVVDCRKQTYKIYWSLPDVTEFDTVLAYPCEDNKQLIHWINIYKDFQKKAKKGLVKAY